MKAFRLDWEDGTPAMNGKLPVESNELEHAQLTAYFAGKLGLKLRVVRNSDNASMGQLELIEPEKQEGTQPR